jgi:MFS family permease
MTFQFKEIAGDATSARQSVTNRSTVLLAQRLGLLIALQLRNKFENAPPRSATINRPLVLLALCLGVLVAQIDTSVVNLATHAIGVTFQAGVAPLQWVLDAYNLVYAVLLLSGGLVADLYGRRRAFAIGAVVMAFGSLVCAFAPAIGVLIAARAVTGLGAALLLPCSLAIIRVVWPEPAARARTLGIWASCNGLAFAIGPSIGGLLIEQFGWRSVFLLVVPLASVALALAWLTVPESADPEGRHFDLPGQVSGGLALAGLALAAITSHDGGYEWIAALLLTALALPTFLWTERRRGAAALVPLDRGGLGGAGAFRHGVRDDQCGADDRRDARCRPARRSVRFAAWRRRRTARGAADRRAGATGRRNGGVRQDQVNSCNQACPSIKCEAMRRNQCPPRREMRQGGLSMNELVALYTRLSRPRWLAYYALPLRLMVGYGFLEHGYAKLARGPESFVAILHALGMPAPALFAGATILIELFGGLAVLLGALIPLASIPMAIVLVVAIVTVHLPNGFSSIKLLSVDAAGAHFGQPGYETDLLYLAALVALAIGGSGPLALDTLLLRRFRDDAANPR